MTRHTLSLGDIALDDQAAMAGTHLQIDLDALAANYNFLKSRLQGSECASVIKADAYGLGAVKVAHRLIKEGCRTFFVAHLSEALALEGVLSPAERLCVLHGPMPGSEALMAEKGFKPVLNSLEQVRAWSACAKKLNRNLPALLQIDTGMSRMGLSPKEFDQIVATPDLSEGITFSHLMSHLACADTPSDATNALQLVNFNKSLKRMEHLKGCLTNSSGIFLGPAYHFDLARPGICLYGGAPQDPASNPMQPVVHLKSKIVNIRTLAPGDGVGYGMSFRADKETRIATIALGYADGFLRALSNRGKVFYRGTALPIAGRVSMDSVGIDISSLGEDDLTVGDFVDILGLDQGIDQLAEDAGTISYEILTSLGARYHRTYCGDLS